MSLRLKAHAQWNITPGRIGRFCQVSATKPGFNMKFQLCNNPTYETVKRLQTLIE